MSYELIISTEPNIRHGQAPDPEGTPLQVVRELLGEQRIEAGTVYTLYWVEFLQKGRRTKQRGERIVAKWTGEELLKCGETSK